MRGAGPGAFPWVVACLLGIAAADGAASGKMARNPNVDVNSARKIAVIPFAEDCGQRRVTAEWETILLSLGYQIVERGDVKAILQEHSLALSGVVNPDQAPKIGELLGVEGMVLGIPNPRPPYHSYSMGGHEEVSEPPAVSVKLIDARTARVIWSMADEPQKEGDVGLGRQGCAVDGSTERAVKKVLRAGDWKFFPEDIGTTSSGGCVFAVGGSIKALAGKRVAVMPFCGEGRHDGREWADKIGGILMEAGYDVVDRAQLDRILKEQAISQTGAIRPQDMVELGKIAGIGGMVMGTIYSDPVCAYGVRLADIQTGEILWSAYGEDCELGGFTKLVNKLAGGKE